MTGSQNASGGLVTVASSSDTPVTPPSMKPLGSRNPFSPRPAERMPEQNESGVEELAGHGGWCK